jgi:hypothetical protein
MPSANVLRAKEEQFEIKKIESKLIKVIIVNKLDIQIGSSSFYITISSIRM